MVLIIILALCGGIYCIVRMEDYKRQIKNLNAISARYTRLFQFADDWLFAISRGFSIYDHIVFCGWKTVVIYGMGAIGKRLLEDLWNQGDLVIPYCIDQKAESIYSVVPVYKLEDCIGRQKPDVVVVTLAVNNDELISRIKQVLQCEIVLLKHIIDEYNE